MVTPFTSSLGTVTDREVLLVELIGAGISGWGEASVMPWPFYTSETISTATYAISKVLLPILFQSRPQSPEDLVASFDKVAGHRIARAAIESAYWDWIAKSINQPLYRLLGGQRNAISVGVAVSLNSVSQQLLDQVAAYVDQGYQRVKLKAAPGQILAPLERIRQQFPSLALMIDANCSYRMSDLDELRALDDFNLTMIEQPLSARDLIGHAELQKLLKTPICLDESIECVDDLSIALKLRSCRIVNIKPARVGGLSEAVRIHDLCATNGIGVWCGGMLETGIGRAASMALATLPNFIYPADLSASARYFNHDIIDPEIKLAADGTLRLSELPGLGVGIDQKRLKDFTVASEMISA